jgi:hypothetical protein
MQATFRALPYVLSWGVLAVVMIVGMTRVPFQLYGWIDSDWARWNVEAILHFGRPFDLSPYSMLAGMGSMYFPNLPWLNPGALALALPLGDKAQSIASFVVYGAELAVSVVLLARAIGLSWLTATAAAQLFLYITFPPFSELFQISQWYLAAPYMIHLIAVLNFATVVLLACGRTPDWRRNVLLSLGFLALFISGLLSAPFTFMFFTPAYVVVCAAIIVMRRPSLAEWGWKLAALAVCLIFFLVSGLLDYYLGTIATAGRTPSAPVAWDQLLSPGAWLRLFRELPLCRDDPWQLLCFGVRGGWFILAALIGAVMIVVRRRGDARTVAWALIGFVGFVHIYAYAYKAEWLGAASVFSNHFLFLSGLCFVFIFAAVPFAESVWSSPPAPGDSGVSESRRLASLALNATLAILLALIVVRILRNPYDSGRYRLPQLIIAATGCGLVVLAIVAIRQLRSWMPLTFKSTGPGLPWHRFAVLAAFPVLAWVHLSLGHRETVQAVRDPSLRNYLQDKISIDVGKPFRGYAATIWLDVSGKIGRGPTRAVFGDSIRYINGLSYFRGLYGETFTYTDLWRSNIPSFEEYGEWTSVQAHAFALKLLAPPGTKVLPNYLRAFSIDSDILRALGVRFVLTDAEQLDQPATLRGALSIPQEAGVHLFELDNVNLGTYSPTSFVKATTADAIADRIRENKRWLDKVAVVSDDVPSTNVRARNVVITVERDGIRVQAESDGPGPAHILLPVQYSNCLVVVSGAKVALARANLFQTLMSFNGAVDARIEFHFGLFANNKCRLRDGAENKMLGL